MGLHRIVEISNAYGANPEFVLAGGGNTSLKADGTLYVKASGQKLATIGEDGFVALDMAKLKAITQKSYPTDEAEAEAEVLADMLASRCPGQSGRPSVEALLHALFPQRYVVHLHPAAVNGLTCGQDGRQAVSRLFPDALWLDEIKPGYTLAMAAKSAMDGCGRPVRLLFLQNHGVFFADETAEGVESLISDTIAAIERELVKKPDMSEPEVLSADVAAAAPIVRALASPNGYACFFTCAELLKAVERAHGNAICAFTPDHIVYCGHAYAVADNADGIESAIAGFSGEYGCLPKIVAVKGLGAFACGESYSEAKTAEALFLDYLKILAYSENFGGPRLMAGDMITFIRGWEVESYRKHAASAGKPKRRLSGKLAVITGGAQGFGAGLADAMCAEGASVVIADINIDGAAAFASSLCGKYGAGAAAAVKCDVSDEASVEELLNAACRAYGGVDLFVSNAGILRSGGLEDMTLRTFELMTKVNYEAFFLCSKYASRVMKLEHKFAPEKYFDIVQINSKSGLSGSNKNFAYAGGKFGGIGLVQSFALELVQYNIKVNAICPGNFLDGPLWTDPERGLFVQYLKAGKVPGAKTVEDVRRAYEAKVPMNRGCAVADVARALFYAVEQCYETGQAIPVTGGQNMLK